MIPAHRAPGGPIQMGILTPGSIPFARILVGIDFSDPAARALQVALAVGEIFASEIVLIHAVPNVYGPQTYPMRAEFLRTNLNRARERMDQLIADEPRLYQLSAATMVAYGSPVGLIQQAAIDENADLIVVGSRGTSGIERLALGSVAETILRKVPCPVLVVGPNCAAVQNPFRSILLATDLETTGLRPVQYARALAKCALSSHLTLLHVIERNPHTPGPDPELFENDLRRELQRLSPPDSGLNCRPRMLLEHGRPPQVIVDKAKAEGASLVIVGLRQPVTLSDHVPWSTLSHIVRDLECSVLVIKNSFH
ncbi:MAG: hypothetical protein BGO25_01555 [Acidobacteriales bacterium 59-55]|nr:MAG: hypothetical protein BGO25_01555 [Acidobacteriales bacterium 59-55]